VLQFLAYLLLNHCPPLHPNKEMSKDRDQGTEGTRDPGKQKAVECPSAPNPPFPILHSLVLCSLGPCSSVLTITIFFTTLEYTG